MPLLILADPASANNLDCRKIGTRTVCNDEDGNRWNLKKDHRDRSYVQDPTSGQRFREEKDYRGNTEEWKDPLTGETRCFDDDGCD